MEENLSIASELMDYFEHERLALENLTMARSPESDTPLIEKIVAENGILYSLVGGSSIAVVTTNGVYHPGDLVTLNRGGNYQSIVEEVVLGAFSVSRSPEGVAKIQFSKPKGSISSDMNLSQITHNLTAEQSVASKANRPPVNLSG